MSYYDATIDNEVQHILELLKSNPCALCITHHLLEIEYTTIEALLDGAISPAKAIDIHNTICLAIADIIAKAQVGEEPDKEVIKSLEEVITGLETERIEHTEATTE